MSRLIEDYLRNLFEEKKVPENQREQLWRYYYDKLSKGVDEGFSPQSSHYDKDLADALKLSIAEFSAFKETSFRKTIETLLVDENGSLRSWSEFKKEAYKVSNDYNHRWLETEYHQTIANAQMAEKWKGFEANADLFPNLKLVSVKDGRVRLEHQVLDGTIRPLNDPFWKTHTPPLDWGCRCDVVQTDEPPTEIKGGLQLKIEFENNPAISGKIFGGSVYMTSGGLTPEMIEKIGNWGARMYKKVERYTSNYASYLKYKKNTNYFDVSFDKKTGGMKAIHKDHNFDKKTGIFEKEILELFYKKGNKIILSDENPKIAGKKVDGFLNGKSFDISSVSGTGGNAIKRALNHSREKKAQIAILHFPNKENFTKDRLKEGVRKYTGQTDYRFDKIIYVVDNIVYYY